jgi:lysylphosphatidylglycerol synthetase-like protein (DUF2156 family)
MRRPRAAGTFVEALDRLDGTGQPQRGLIGLALGASALAVVAHEPHEGRSAVLAGLLVLVLLARAVTRLRGMDGRQVAASASTLAVAYAASSSGHELVSLGAVVAAGAVAGLPERPPPAADDDERRHVWALVDATPLDPLAPFALRSDKSYVFTRDRCAAVAYRVRFGTAVASGDPVGDPTRRAEAIETFLARADASGWRVAAVGVSEHVVGEWRRHGLRAVSIGRDVVLHVDAFSLEGRRLRNVRQAVQRTHNAGVSTEIVSERDLPETTRAELEEVRRDAGKTSEGRGFSMGLDHLLEPVHRGTFIALARDRSGRVVAFQRYAGADGGRELSLDVPCRVPAAPNGVDERLIVDVVDWGRQRGVRRVSLTFAAFPELFDATDRGPVRWAAYRLVRMLDRFIRLESLYRFLRKFHALGERRYVVLRPSQVAAVAAAALRLEFSSPAKRR